MISKKKSKNVAKKYVRKMTKPNIMAYLVVFIYYFRALQLCQRR